MFGIKPTTLFVLIIFTYIFFVRTQYILYRRGAYYVGWYTCMYVWMDGYSSKPSFYLFI